LLEQLTELKETLIYIYQITIRDIAKHTGEYLHRAKHMEKSAEFPHPLWTNHPQEYPPTLPRNSLNPVLWGFYGDFTA
jgi:hypothetical protein